MKEKERKLMRILLCLVVSVIFWGLSLQNVRADSDSEESEAAEETQPIEFDTDYEVTAAADGYFIVKDPNTEKYGLLDEEGEEVIACEYDEMEFPEDSAEYDYLLVKQGNNYGILDYSGEELIDVNYDSIDPYRDGNTVAAAYNGSTTDLFNIKGTEIGKDLTGKYTVVSDNVFQGETDLSTEKGNSILNFEEYGLLIHNKDSNETKAHVFKIGKKVAVDYDVNIDGTAKDEEFGKMSTYRYIKIYNEDGEEDQKITPEESWTEDEKDEVRGGIMIEDVISDHSLVVRLTAGFKEKEMAVYDIDEKKFSSLYNNIGVFYDGKAFALDEDNELWIIDETGSPITDQSITVKDFKRDDFRNFKKTAFAKFKNKKDKQWKLYSLKTNQELNTVYSTVDFAEDEDENMICQGMPLVSNEDGKYTILTQEGEPLFDYGKYSKEDLLNQTVYSDSCVCVVTKDGEKYEVHGYLLDTGDEDSLLNNMESKLKNPLVLAAIVAIVILLLLIICLIILLKKRAKARRAQQRTQERRRQFEERANRQRGRNKQQGAGAYQQNRFAGNKPSVPVDQTIRITPPDVVKQPKQSKAKAQPSRPFYGAMECLTGEYAGAKIALSENEWIRIGRDEKDNDLVIKNSKVSRKHCAISYDPLMEQYLVIDYSRNGVFLQDGTKLIQNQKSLIKENAEIYLGSEQIVIKLLPNPGR